MKNDVTCTLRPVSLDEFETFKYRKGTKWVRMVCVFLKSEMDIAEVTGIDVTVLSAYRSLAKTAGRIGGVRVVLRDERIFLIRTDNVQQIGG